MQKTIGGKVDAPDIQKSNCKTILNKLNSEPKIVGNECMKCKTTTTTTTRF